MSHITAGRVENLDRTRPAERPLPPVPDVRRRGLLVRVLTPLASLRLTVALFALSLVLVFCGTLAMMNASIFAVVNQYFRSWGEWGFVWVPWQLFVQLGQVFFGVSRELTVAGGFPFPTGYVLGSLMMANLLAAHALRFRLSWRRAGILVLHSGVVVLMVSEFITGTFATEGHMTLVVGGSSNYMEETDHTELAVTTPASSTEDDVVVVPDGFLRRPGLVPNDLLPFDVEVLRYLTNSALVEPKKGTENPADRGLGQDVVAEERAPVAGTSQEQKVDLPSAYVRFREKGSGAALGTYLVSLQLTLEEQPAQKVQAGGKTYEVALRFKRTYKPYTVTLLKFNHEVYPGTDKPKDFSSYIRLVDPSRAEDREARIWMNHPLRYAGDSLYQASFLKGDQGTVLQIVRNPASPFPLSWLTLPILGCLMVAAGLLAHFCMKLTGFLRQTLPLVRRRIAGRTTPAFWGVPGAVLGMGGLYLLAVMFAPTTHEGTLPVEDAAGLPVLDGGRVKPLDSLARTDLMILSGRQEFEDEQGKTQPAIKWLLDVMTSDLAKRIQRQEFAPADRYKVFRIDNLEVLNLLGLERRKGFLYAVSEFADRLDLVEREASRAAKLQKEGRELDLFDRKILELREHLWIYLSLSQLRTPMVPPAAGASDNEWKDLRSALREIQAGEPESAAAVGLFKIVLTYTKADARGFKDAVADYQKVLDRERPSAARQAGLEVFYNHLAPFYQCAVLYVLAFVLVCLSWLVWREPLRRAAFWLTVLTLLVHTGAILTRMYLQGRPPVTNLYSSAIFIGWGGVLFGLVLEGIFRIGIGTAAGALIGFATGFVSHYLAAGGDTLEMLQAVLDTNFWLATHVTCVTLGYTATYVAGALGVAYLCVRGSGRLVDPNLRSLPIEVTGGPKVDLFRVLSQMLYGVICFAMLFSFVGTVLGGIWADQSWGRFWGWDPKENGALLIVIWNALILHARWAGLVKQPGMARLAVVGNMITGWSWFGTNQLGVGLHAYGFNDALAVGLRWFWVSQLVLLAAEALTLIPWHTLFRPRPAAS